MSAQCELRLSRCQYFGPDWCTSINPCHNLCGCSLTHTYKCPAPPCQGCSGPKTSHS